MRPAPPDLPDTLRVLANQIPEMDVELILANHLLRQVANRTSACFNDCLRQHGLSENLWYALLALYARPGHEILPSQLSAMLALTRTSATRLSDEMVQQGWAVRHAHAHDRRKITLRLTDAGRDKIHRVSPHTNALRRQLWAALNTQQRQQLQAGLLALLAQTQSAATHSGADDEPQTA